MHMLIVCVYLKTRKFPSKINCMHPEHGSFVISDMYPMKTFSVFFKPMKLIISDFAKAEIFYRTFGLVKSNISPDRIKICRTEKFKWNFDK